MNISLVTPAGRESRNGNWVTAARWRRLLCSLGHRVRIDNDYDGHPSDCLIAVHAFRSARAIASFKRQHPSKPLVVLLAGTDINKFQHSHPQETRASMQAASKLVGLHDLVHREVPAEYASRLEIIYQSAEPPPDTPARANGVLTICVIGHLREEKDPLRTAYAAKALAPDSNIRVVHLGKALDDTWAEAARVEMARNARYVWRGEVSPGEVKTCLASSDAMVISSVMEGGANVVSEAIVARLPVLASRIAGNVGLLGDEHPGYFEPRDTDGLRTLLEKCEKQSDYLPSLAAHGRTREALFSPERERESWRRLLEEVSRG